MVKVASVVAAEEAAAAVQLQHPAAEEEPVGPAEKAATELLVVAPVLADRSASTQTTQR